jgi:hypothetical protein
VPGPEQALCRHGAEAGDRRTSKKSGISTQCHLGTARFFVKIQPIENSRFG